LHQVNPSLPKSNYSVNRTLTRYAGSRRLPQALGAMLLLRVNLEASSNNPTFAPGTKVAANLFAEASDVTAAAEQAAVALADQGWSELKVERAKEITDYAQYKGERGVLAQAFRKAQKSGFAIVLYPEPSV
jgi:hypothetical protein